MGASDNKSGLNQKQDMFTHNGRVLDKELSRGILEQEVLEQQV